MKGCTARRQAGPIALPQLRVKRRVRPNARPIPNKRLSPVPRIALERRAECSDVYKYGKIAGVIEGSIPFLLRGVAAAGTTRIGLVLNANRYVRIRPGRWGGSMISARMSSP